MIEPRIASDVQIKAMQRIAEGQGNFLTIIGKGDPVSGSIVIIARKRGDLPRILERFPTLDGEPKWEASGPKTVESEQDISEWIDRRKARDPDLWIVELDIADDAQLDAIIGQKG